jgi:hypothetical protein
MIFGRFGDVVRILRMGTLQDIRKLDKRTPDKIDKAAIASGSYVVVRQDNGEERLYHLAFLRATDGSREISKAIEELEE